jgi:hypothetical protein
MLGLSVRAAFPAELVILRNGSVIRLDRHETHGAVTRLYLDTGVENFVDMPVAQIDRFEEAIEPPAEITAPPVQTANLADIVLAASSRYGVDPDLIFSLIHAESGFDPHAVSPKGARGLMQLMPQTAISLGVENPIDAAANVDGGTRYLRELLIRYNQDITKALAAYNAGPSRIQQFHGVPPYPETIRYITRVVRDLNRRRLAKAHLESHLSSRLIKTGNPGPAARTFPAAGAVARTGSPGLEMAQPIESQ